MSLDEAIATIKTIQDRERSSVARSKAALVSFSRQPMTVHDGSDNYWTRRINADPDPHRTRVARSRAAIQAGKHVRDSMAIVWVEQLHLLLCVLDMTVSEARAQRAAEA